MPANSSLSSLSLLNRWSGCHVVVLEWLHRPHTHTRAKGAGGSNAPGRVLAEPTAGIDLTPSCSWDRGQEVLDVWGKNEIGRRHAHLDRFRHQTPPLFCSYREGGSRNTSGSPGSFCGASLLSGIIIVIDVMLFTCSVTPCR